MVVLVILCLAGILVLENEVSSVCGGSSYTDKKSEVEQERNKLEE